MQQKWCLKSLIFISSLLFCFLFGFSMSGEISINSRNEKIFRAGASTSNITPYLGNGIVGAVSTPPPAKNIHDELHARSLVLDDGEKKLVFVVVDNISIRREVFDAAKKLVYEQTGIPTENMMMSAIHTHSATSANGEGEKRRRAWNMGKPFEPYQLFIIRRIADGVRIALNHLEPARIGWGVAEAPEHVFNRRWIMKELLANPWGQMDKVKMNPGIGNPNAIRPAGTTDSEISFVSVKSSHGRPIAVLANYSLHYVGGVPRYDISADYFAVFADRIQQLLGADRLAPPFVGIMSNGTSGDVNNIDVRGGKEMYAPYEKMHIVGYDVAAKVFHAIQKVQYHNWVKLYSIQTELPLKVRQPTEAMLQKAKKILRSPDTAELLYNRKFAQRTLWMYNSWPKEVNVILQAFRVGDLCIAAIPFEVYAKIGLEIKRKSPFKSTFTIELANGNYDYLPTPEQFELGGYTTWYGPNKVEKNASKKIKEKVLSLFYKLK